MQDFSDLTAKYPLGQYLTRKKILILLEECKEQELDWTHHDSLVSLLSRWDDLEQPSLEQVLGELQGFKTRMQGIKKFFARQEEKQNKRHKLARILAFPTPPETLQAILARQEDPTEKTGRPATNRKGAARSKRGEVEASVRKRLLAKIHIAKKDLMRQLPEFSDDTYRFIMEMKYGVSSARTLTNKQLQGLLVHFQDMGWKQLHKGAESHPLLSHDPAGLGRDALMRKIQALLAEKGTNEGAFVPLSYALSILKRQTGNTVTAFEDALPEHLRAVISALTRNAARQGRRAR